MDNFTRLYGITGTEAVKPSLDNYVNTILAGPLTPRGQNVRDYCDEVENFGWMWLQSCKGKDQNFATPFWKKSLFATANLLPNGTLARLAITTA